VSAIEKLTVLLRQYGCTLKRQKKHQVWSLPNGKTFTRAATPSDRRAANNSLSDLKRELGLTKQTATVGVRRERKAKIKRDNRPTFNAVPVNPALADQLRVSGSVESVLRDRIAELEERMNHCWGCRFRSWWNKRLKVLTRS